MMKKEISYPAQITFKSVFRHHPDISGIIGTILNEHLAEAQVGHRYSKNGKFVSYTITAEFSSESHLNETCARISSIQGFIMMI
jgi:putative lipoic acid-binding regulatory protein